jgi:hypothetical protein
MNDKNVRITEVLQAVDVYADWVRAEALGKATQKDLRTARRMAKGQIETLAWIDRQALADKDTQIEALTAERDDLLKRLDSMGASAGV